jgi:hypothetical protein
MSKKKAVKYLSGVLTREGKKVKARMSAKEREKYVKEANKKLAGEMKDIRKTAGKLGKRTQNILQPSESKLKGFEKFIAKKFNINTKKNSPGSVRAKIEEETAKRELRDRASYYEPRFKSKGGSVKKKKVVKLKVGGALTDYYKGMM